MGRKTICIGMFLGALAGICEQAGAGEVGIRECNPGSTAIVWWNDGIGLNGQPTTDLNGDGDMLDAGETVTVPNQDDVVEISVTKELGFDTNGDPISSRKVQLLEPFTLAALEPLNTPTFGALTPGKKLAPVIDVPAYVGAGVTFHRGQVLVVTNGTIPQTSSIRFKDSSSVPNAMIPQLFDDTFRNALPDYNGDVLVSYADYFRQPPTAVPDESQEVHGLTAFPNPFGHATNLTFFLPISKHVRAGVYDIAGHLVKGLRSGVMSAGAHRVPWDGLDSEGHEAKAGMYLLVVESDGRVFSTKVVRTK